MPRTANASFMKLQRPDAILAAIVGPEPRSRPDITVRIWAYIKSASLQDTKNRRQINAGTPEFRALLGGADSCTMFELPKFVGLHISPAEA
jgi:chromatin remodeling complex protein RSC6